MPKRDYKGFIAKLLDDGPKLGSHLYDKLEEKYAIKRNTARKNVNRLIQQGVIYDSRPLRFLGNEYGYSLSPDYKEYISLLDNKPKLKSLYYLFRKYKIVSENDVLKYGALINSSNTKYYDLEKAKRDLAYLYKNFHLIRYNDINFYTASSGVEDIEEQYLNLLKTKKIDVNIMPFVLSYCTKINLISRKPWYVSRENPFGTIQVRQNLAFDATAFTNIGNPNKEKTLCVFDFSVNEDYTKERLNAFKYRYETLIHATKHIKQRVIPIIVYNNMDWSLENELSMNNVIIKLKLSTIFGSRISSFLKVLEASKIGRISEAKDILKIVEQSDYAKQLTRFFPFVFETIINELINRLLLNKYSYQNSKTIRLRDGKEKEYDGWFETEDHILIVESKFYKKNMIKWEEKKNGKLKNTCVKYFFKDKIDFLKKWLEERGDKRRIKALFVSANGFYKDVGTNIEAIDNDYKMNSLPLVLTATELLKKCKTNHIAIKPHKEWLDRYYIRKNLRIKDVNDMSTNKNETDVQDGIDEDNISDWDLD